MPFLVEKIKYECQLSEPAGILCKRSRRDYTAYPFGGKESRNHRSFDKFANGDGSIMTSGQMKRFHPNNNVISRKKPRIENMDVISHPRQNSTPRGSSHDLAFRNALPLQPSHARPISKRVLSGAALLHGTNRRIPREIPRLKPIPSAPASWLANQNDNRTSEVGRNCFPASYSGDHSILLDHGLEAPSRNSYSAVFECYHEELLLSCWGVRRDTTLDSHNGITFTPKSDDWSLNAIVESARRLSETGPQPRSVSMKAKRPNSTLQQAGNDQKQPTDQYRDTDMVDADEIDRIPHLLEDPQTRFEEGKRETDQKLNPTEPKADNPSEVAAEDCEEGTSLTDFFTAKQIRVHLKSLNPANPFIGVDVDPADSARLHAYNENTCQLCEKETLNLAPPPLNCASCGACIKLNSNYYSAYDVTEKRSCFCSNCFTSSRKSIPFMGTSISKKALQKEKNIEQDEEAWVKCDECERWQHQICALYNKKLDLGGNAKYICPFCRLAKIAAKENMPIPTAIGAKDLPRTLLSDHIEQRLLKGLKRDRKQRADSAGKSFEEVPGASNLSVRVVLIVKKVVKVSPKFSGILHNEEYPSEFPYRSKVILLFQKIDGVDVCIFAMYVQEFGSECAQPNQRCVYISYLDSVKYFSPNIRSASGEALRTLAYHEILVGYLDYCKQCGFSTCYIWVCPPSTGDEYILNCHPETQKIPKNDQLLHWYKSFLRKAEEEKVVTGYTNFYEDFFLPNGRKSHKITAARLPYFDGDYWSGTVEEIVCSMEEGGGGKFKSREKKSLTNRHCGLSGGAIKDFQVMQKLEHGMIPIKEDFLVIHLQFNCKNCSQAIVAGKRWSCKKCSKFHLCSKCHEQLEQNPKELPALEKHAISCGEDNLCQFAISLPKSTDDRDVNLDNEIFENRYLFLSFCQKNGYQFNALRHAKYSSMMILHHVRTMTSLTMGTNCSICHKDTMVEWCCETCPEFYICTDCYKKDGAAGCHEHGLVKLLQTNHCRTKIKKMQAERASEVRIMLELLEHANQCTGSRRARCSEPQCARVKSFVQHNQVCNHGVAGGCKTCKKIWFLLNLHSRKCKDSNCPFPRCLDIKYFKEKMATQSETRRRAAAAAAGQRER